MEQDYELVECECGQQGCGCSQSQCGAGEYDRMAMMMYLAKAAKMELIKKKIKEKLEVVEGKKLDKIADLLVEAITEYHQVKADIGKRKQGMKEKFEAIFMEG